MKIWTPFKLVCHIEYLCMTNGATECERMNIRNICKIMSDDEFKSETDYDIFNSYYRHTILDLYSKYCVDVFSDNVARSIVKHCLYPAMTNNKATEHELVNIECLIDIFDKQCDFPILTRMDREHKDIVEKFLVDSFSKYVLMLT